MMKKALVYLMCALYLFSIPVTACATDTSVKTSSVESSGGEWVIQTENGESVLYNTSTGKKIYQAISVTNGQVTELSLEEYANMLNAAIEDAQAEGALTECAFPEGSVEPRAVYFYRYDETSSEVVYGEPEQVSASIEGPANISIEYSVTISESYGGSVNVSSTNVKQTISGGASFNWNKSASSSTSANYSFPVPAGKECYIQFTPKLNKTTGKLYRATSDPTTGFVSEYVYLGQVWGKSPVKLNNGLADGTFALVENS